GVPGLPQGLAGDREDVLAVFRGVSAHPGSSLLSGHLSGTVISKRKGVRISSLGGAMQYIKAVMTR
ncbi:MAG: hypothetical protein WA895_10500, partial [Streptosporangiaceae bacterium]